MDQSPSNFSPQAVLFDAYGTLFDVYSVAQLAEQLFPGHGKAISVVWRDKQIEYTRLVTTSNLGAHYKPFWELTRAALVYAIKKIAATAGSTGAIGTFDALDSRVDTLMNQYRHLSAFPEDREVLTALKAKGIATGILSNRTTGLKLTESGGAEIGDEAGVEHFRCDERVRVDLVQNGDEGGEVDAGTIWVTPLAANIPVGNKLT